jgi:hypothetical protein
MRFELYLESGPRHRKTWVFVPGQYSIGSNSCVDTAST